MRGKGGRSYLGPPKSRAGRRTMTMPGWLAEMLAAHLRQRGLSGADTDAFVFVWPGGGHLTYSSWRKHWLIAINSAGAPERLRLPRPPPGQRDRPRRRRGRRADRPGPSRPLRCASHARDLRQGHQ